MDADGESLVLNLMQANGSDVPAWIKFTPQNRLVYGKANTTLTSIDLKITATDPKTATASTLFTLNILKNKPPLVINEIGSINSYMQMYFQYQVPETIFRDEDGDSLTYSLVPFDSSAVVPVWLSFI